MVRPFPTLMRWIVVFGIVAFGLLALAVWTSPAQSGPQDPDDRPWDDEQLDDSDDYEEIAGWGDTPRDPGENREPEPEPEPNAKEFRDPLEGEDDITDFTASHGAGEIGGFHCSSAPTHLAWTFPLMALALFSRRRR